MKASFTEGDHLHCIAAHFRLCKNAATPQIVLFRSKAAVTLRNNSAAICGFPILDFFKAAIQCCITNSVLQLG